MSVYLDYNASAPIDERVLDCMIDVYKIISAMRIAGRMHSVKIHGALWKLQESK